MKTISIGVPVRNEELNIPELQEILSKVAHQLEEMRFKVEIIINNNASQDNSLSLLEKWQVLDHRVKINHFDVGVSFQHSILELMRSSSGDAFVIYQSDMQDPANLIIDFVEKWQTTDKVIAGVIMKRNEKWRNSFFRKFFYYLLRVSSDGKILIGFQDFYLLPRFAYERLSKLSPEGLFIRGHISTAYPELEIFRYERIDRKNGKSNFNFVQKYMLALDGILLFGTRLIRLISITSFTVFLLSTISGILILCGYFMGFKGTSAGWTSLVLLFLILISMFGMIGSLILEYLLRIYRFLLLSDSNQLTKSVR